MKDEKKSKKAASASRAGQLLAQQNAGSQNATSPGLGFGGYASVL